MKNHKVNKKCGYLDFSWGGGGILRRLFAGILCLSAALSARGDNTWTYSGTNKTITDAQGQWTLKVSSFDKETKTLTFPYQASKDGWTDPKDATSGILDLRSPLVISDSADNSSTTVSSVSITKSFYYDDNIVEFYCDIIGKMNGPTADGDFQGCSNMTTIDIGGSADTISGLFLSKCSKLKTIKLDFPNMRTIGNNNGHAILGVNTTPNAIDISTVATPGVTNIYKTAFSHGYWKGDIAFTNIMAIGWGAFRNASLTNVFLAGTLATLPSEAFSGNSITNIVLDLTNSATVASDTFNNQAKIRRVELVSALQDMSQVTNIVRFADNSKVGDLCIYVSKAQWTDDERAAATYDADNNPAGFFAPKSELTSAELVTIDPEIQPKVFGVLIKGGTKKGIFVHKKSIHDPSGLFIRIR